MNEEQKEQNIPAPVPPDNNNQNIAPVKNGQLKKIIVLVVILFFIIGGYFVWQNYQKSKPVSSTIPSAEKEEENTAVSTIKSLSENRDIKRKIDLVNLLLALQNYKKDKNIYPSTNGVTEKTEDKNSVIYSLVSNYIKNISTDPQSPDFYYGYNSDGKSFTLTAKLENEKDLDCTITGKICLYKLTEKNNEEELLKIVRENLEFISSIRVVSMSDWTIQKPGKDPYRLLGTGNTVSESMLDLTDKKAYAFSYSSDSKDKKNSESIIINGKLYSKNSMMASSGGIGSWMELKEGDELPRISDTPGADNTFHMPDLSKVFSIFDFIKSVSDIKKITVENIKGKEYYRLSLQPKHKERNKFLDEYLSREMGVYGTGKSIDELFASETEEEYIFEKEQVFKFIENNKQIVIPFSKLITRPIFRVLLIGSQYDENEYTVSVISITGDVWIDKETYMPFRENTSKYDIRYDYNLKTKEKGFWEEANEITGNIEYLDINKDFDIKAPELAKVEDIQENKKLAIICDKIKAGYSKGQCVEAANTKKIFYYGMEFPTIRTLEDCEKIPHSTYFSNQSYDDCILQLFKRTKDISLCEKAIDHMEDRVICYTEAAKMTGNKDYCRKINYDYMKVWCKDNVSSSLICHGKDANVLSFTESKSLIDAWEKYCMIMAEKDESKCAGLEEVGARENNCYNDMAILKKDILLCDKMYSDKDYCYAKVAAAVNDVSLCDKIEGEQKDNCIVSVAVVNVNENLCEKLSNDSTKDSCYLKIVYGLIQK